MKKLPLYLCFVPLLWAGSGDTRSPVIVELFTSEGCSSCPPADDLLARLEHQNISNARVIALEEHVDYWNHLGWTDPFSSPLYTARQNEYAVAFKVDSVYTPQMIINGRVEFVGNSGGRAASEIQRAALETMATVRLRLLQNRKNNELTDLAVTRALTFRSPVPKSGHRDANPSRHVAFVQQGFDRLVAHFACALGVSNRFHTPMMRQRVCWGSTLGVMAKMMGEESGPGPLV